MRILALDVGERRVGIALSDPIGIISTPLPCLERTQLESDIRFILDKSCEYDVSRIVVGMPVTLRGKVGFQAKEVESFCESLRCGTDIPIIMWDERYSTVEARKLTDRRPDRKASKISYSIDSVAAAVILQAYLESLRHQ